MAAHLFDGDNLDVLCNRDADGRPWIADEGVDLIYLDPPFNSAARAYEEGLTQVTHTGLATMMRGIVAALGKNDMTAYPFVMVLRLIQLHRVRMPGVGAPPAAGQAGFRDGQPVPLP